MNYSADQIRALAKGELPMRCMFHNDPNDATGYGTCIIDQGEKCGIMGTNKAGCLMWKDIDIFDPVKLAQDVVELMDAPAENECHSDNANQVSKENIVEPTYYAVKDDKGFIELRQTRFKEAYYGKGLNHPHDVCAVARDVEEMKRMVGHWTRSLKGDVDYSAVLDQQEAP